MPPKRARSASSSPRRERTKADVLVPINSESRPGLHLIHSMAHGASSSSGGLSAFLAHQEIFLRVLSFLDASELAGVQGVNRYWQYMSLDQQLWKRLYLSRYPHPHHAKLHTPTSTSRSHPRQSLSTQNAPLSRSVSISGSSTPRALRPIARLPSRAFPPPSPSRSPSVTLHDVTAREEEPGGLVRGKGKSVAVNPHRMNDAEETDGEDQEIGTGVRNDGVDWKLMLRLGTNWLHGNASAAETITLPPSPSPSIASLSRDLDSSARESSIIPDKEGASEQHVALSPALIFTSNPSSPLVQVHAATLSPSDRSTHLGIIPPPPGWSSPNRPDNVTAIVTDQAVLIDDGKTTFPTRLGIFYQSGGFVITQVRQIDNRLIWNRESISPPTTRPVSIRRRATTFTPLQGDPVVLAALHSPVLVTCTRAFHLTVYSIPTLNDNTPTRPRHLRTLHSDVSYHPAALSLLPSAQLNDASTSPSDMNTLFRVALTYCTPVYPSSWTVAVQELSVDLAAPPLLASIWTDQHAGRVHRGDCLVVGSEMDEPDDPFVWPRRARPAVSVRGAAGIGSDGRWCVLAGKDGVVEVFALPTTSTPEVPEGDGKIHHAQTLVIQPQTSLSAIALDAGRCVTGGTDGRVLVWDLDVEGEDQMERGRTVGFVEVGVRRGGRTRQREVWRGAAGPAPLHSAEYRLPGKAGDGGEYESESDSDQPDSNSSVDQPESKRQKRLNNHESPWPHPQSISAAARALFLPLPPILGSSNTDNRDDADLERNDERQRAVIRHLMFDEEKIVGIVRGENEIMRTRGSVGAGGGLGEIMKVWRFG